jgi:FemAB-related protein (PEP-CTERM system-associated)
LAQFLRAGFIPREKPFETLDRSPPMSFIAHVTTPNLDAPVSAPPVPQSTSPLEVRPAALRDDAAADALVRELGGSLFQRSGWLRSVERVFGHKRSCLHAYRGSELVGTLPLMTCKGLLGGKHLISSPYGVYGGPVGRDEEVVNALLEAALTGARAAEVGRLELRSRDRIDHADLAQSDKYVTFIKDLPETPEGILKGMKKDERRLVRRAADTHGLVMQEGNWFLEDLTRLFHASKQRLGSPGLPGAWFHTLLELLGEELVIHLVRREQEVLAVSMCFVDGDELRMYYIGTGPTVNRDYATTSFMISELQKWALERGMKRFDLGRSRADAGAVKFKKNQGFKPEPLNYCYGLIRSQELPSFTPSNPKTAWLRETWAQLPSWLCVRLSGTLSKYLP